jgi:VCBS repeat protein
LEFTIDHLAVVGDVRHVNAADLDGDGKLDLVAVTVRGEGENAERAIAIFWNRGGSFSPHPDVVVPAPADLCAFDLADVDGQAGAELVEVTPSGIRLQSWVGRIAGAPRDLLRQPTLFLRASREQLPRFRLLHALGPNRAPSMMVPGLGTLSVYSRTADGFARSAELPIEVVESVDIPGHEDADNSMEGLPRLTVSARFPELHVVDINGDGRADLALVDGETVRAFLQTPEGGFTPHPTFVHNFAVRNAKEIASSDVDVHVQLSDIDGDGRADAIVTKQVSEGISSARTTVHIFLGSPEGFRSSADQVIETQGAKLAPVQLADVNGDGKPDLLVPSVEMGLFSVIRILTTKSLKVNFQLHTLGADRHFTEKPTADRNLVFKVDLDGHSDMQAVDIYGDYDGDGHLDLAFGTAPEELALYRGGLPNEVFSDEPMAKIPVRAYGHLLPVALDGGRRTDLVLWYPDTRGHKHEIAVVHVRAPAEAGRAP